MLRLTLTLICCVILNLPFGAFAKPPFQLHIINHFDKPIKFIVGINPDVVPDIPENLILQPQWGIDTRVLDLKKEAYIRVEDGEGNMAFWGVLVEDQVTQVHGYMSEGIAYSWNNKEIVFCTPEEYKKRCSCL